MRLTLLSALLRTELDNPVKVEFVRLDGNFQRSGSLAEIGGEFYRVKPAVAGQQVPSFYRLGKSFIAGVINPLDGDRVNLVLTEVRGERVALAAERIDGQQQIYVKPVPELLAHKRALAGLTILGDGRPIFLADLNQML